jgi:hypothetical protein
VFLVSTGDLDGNNINFLNHDRLRVGGSHFCFLRRGIFPKQVWVLQKFLSLTNGHLIRRRATKTQSDLRRVSAPWYHRLFQGETHARKLR